jgi:hypothetical protein
MEIMLISAQDRCMVCVERTLGTNIILDKLDGTPMFDQVKLVSVHLETVLMSMQDRCIICAKCVIGSEIVLDAPDGTPSCVGQVDAHFVPFGGSVIVVKDR